MKNIKIHPLTFVLFFLLLFFGYINLILPYTLAVTLHELGHAHVAKKCGYKLDKLWILPYGASLNFNNYSFDAKDEIKIAIAGPLVNVFIIFVCVSFWWLFPESYVISYNFVISNFCIFAFNLLPAFPLDGSRLLIGLLSTKNKRNAALAATKVFNFVFAGLFFVLFCISIFYSVNYSFFAIAFFMILGIFESKFQSTYSPLIYQFKEKTNKQTLPVKHIYASGQTPVYKIVAEFNKHKFNVVYVETKNGKIKIINELDIQKLLIFTSPKTKLKDLIN